MDTARVVLVLALICSWVASGCKTNVIGANDTQQSDVSSDTQQPDLVVADQTAADQQGTEFSVRSLQIRSSSTNCPPAGQTREPELQSLGVAEVKGVLVTSPVHDSDDGLQRFYVADTSGGVWAGMAVVMESGLKTVTTGDLLNIRGELQERFCFTRLRVTRGSDIELVQADLPVPTAATVSCSTLANKGQAEALEGVLIKVFGVNVDQSDSTSLRLTDNRGCVVGNDFKLFTPLPLPGTQFNWVVGVVRYQDGLYVIHPRSANDLNTQNVVFTDIQLDAISLDQNPPPDLSDKQNPPDIEPADQPTLDLSTPDLVDTSVPDLVVDSVEDLAPPDPDLSDTAAPDDLNSPLQSGCESLGAIELINEVRYDSPGNDYESKLSFIELIGPANTEVGLVGLVTLEHINGSDGKVIFSVKLDGISYGSNGMLLIVDDDHPQLSEMQQTGSTIVKICTDKTACETSPPAGCQCITSGAGSHNTIAGLNAAGGLQNGPDCLILRYNIGTIDQLCWTKSSTWDANSNHWKGEPPWDPAFVSDTNFPRQGTSENSIGRMSCLENNDNRTDFHRTVPSPGTLNLQAN